MSDAKALALSHPSKPWARRWLRLHGSSWLAQVNHDNQAVRRIQAVKRFIRGAAHTFALEPK